MRGRAAVFGVWLRTAVAVAALLGAGALAMFAGDAAGQGGSVEFTDWTDVTGNTATGTLRGKTVTLSGSQVDPPPQSTVDGTSTYFADPYFTPPLPQSDAIQFRGFTDYSYTLSFGPATTTDPVLHLASLASTLTFPPGTSITKVSGEDAFMVSGNTVVGALDGPNDANGTVRLNGTFSSVSFTAEAVFPGNDGIVLQVGEPVPPPPTTGPPQNSTAPVIREAGGGAYTCDPGEWSGAASFSYKWFLYTGLGETRELASTQTYTPQPSDYGYWVGCTVTATGPGGSADAQSPNVIFSSEGMDRLPPAYGDVRIRGIDLFQVVQPNKGARMFGYEPSGRYAPEFCGGGTPTNYLLGGNPCYLAGGDAQTVTYSGVRLDRYKPTTAVVYVDVAGAAPSDPDLEYELEVWARPQGRSLRVPARFQESMVTTVRNPERSDTPWVEAFERDSVQNGDDNRHGIFIQLPEAWTSVAAPIRLFARIKFPESSSGTAGFGVRQCDDQGCLGNDRFTLTNIPIVDFPELLFAPLQLRRQTASPTPQGGFRRPRTVLSAARTVFPGTDLMDIPGYRADLDITAATGGPNGTDFVATPVPMTNPQQFRCGKFIGENLTTRSCRSAYVQEVVDRWIGQFPARSRASGGIFGSGVVRNYDVVMGVHNYDAEPGWANPNGNISILSSTEPQAPTLPPYFTATANTRPLTAAAHELGHVLTAPHAGHDCPFPVGSPPPNNNLTGPGTGANEGEPWNDDDVGFLQSVKFKTDLLFGGGFFISRSEAFVSGRFVYGSGVSTETTLYDFMSYCADLNDTDFDDRDSWISSRNWNRAQVELGKFDARLRGSAASSAARAGRSGRADASQAGKGAPYASGVAGPGGADIGRILISDGDDAVPAPVDTSPVRLRSLGPNGQVLLDAGVDVRQTSESLPGDPGTFLGPVARGATALELVRDGTVLDRAEQSRAPTVRITAPRRGARVGRRLNVRWRASDPDGQALRAIVDFSPDGRHWRPIYDGPSTGRITLPGSYLSGSRRARVRVRVSDGFSERSAVSKPFRALGARPRVTIASPGSDSVIRAGEPVLLTGRAYDDLGRVIRGRSLTWFAGRTRLGRGASLTARIPRRTRRLRLVARDRTGRTGAARVPIRVEVPRLTIVSLAVPPKVARGTRRMKVRIQASAPATLRVAGRRHRLGRRARRVTVRLPRRPAVGILEVPFRLRPRGGSARGSVQGVFSTARV